MSRPVLDLGERCLPAGRALARRRRDRRRHRRRLWLAPLALMLLAGCGAGSRWLLTADRFAVARVETGPYRFTEPAVLEARLGTALGASIWTRDVETRLGQALGDLPWLSRFRLQRRLPATVRVELEEWRPLLLVQPDSLTDAGGRALVLVADGRVLPFPAHLPPPDLPLLVGVPLAAAAGPGHEPAWRVPPVQVPSLLALEAAVAETGLEALAPIDFVLAESDGLTLVLQRGQARLRLGQEDYAGRLRRYLAVRSEIAAGAVVDLRFQRRVFVEAAPPPEPESLPEGGEAAVPVPARGAGRDAPGGRAAGRATV